MTVTGPARIRGPPFSAFSRHRPPHDRETDEVLAEFLMGELANNHPVLLPAHPPRSLLEEPRRHTGGPQGGYEEQHPVTD